MTRPTTAGVGRHQLVVGQALVDQGEDSGQGHVSHVGGDHYTHPREPVDDHAGQRSQQQHRGDLGNDRAGDPRPEPAKRNTSTTSRNFHRKTDLIGGPVFTGPDASLRDLSMNRSVEGLASQFLVELGTEGPRNRPGWRGEDDEGELAGPPR